MSAYRLNALLWSIGCVVGGVLLLLFNFESFVHYERWTQYIFAGVLAVLGVVFLIASLSSREHWWRLIPGWTLLALAVMIYLSSGSAINGQQTAPILFLGLTCAFTHIYLLDRAERWWAILPGGFMLVLAIVIGVSNAIAHLEILFIGMGLVFFLLYAADGRRRQWWALIPGGVLTLFGCFIFAAVYGEQFTIIRWWPILLVLIGLIFGWQATRRAPPQPLMVNQAPRPSLRNHSSGSVTAAATTLPKPVSNGPSEYTRPAPCASVEILPDLYE
ncbi:MAG: hypothetical protein NT075_12935 [Chloroflexi bacterium]|nr:hypothetical protein [Chloroflexota bacterium]